MTGLLLFVFCGLDDEKKIIIGQTLTFALFAHVNRSRANRCGVPVSLLAFFPPSEVRFEFQNITAQGLSGLARDSEKQNSPPRFTSIVSSTIHCDNMSCIPSKGSECYRKHRRGKYKTNKWTLLC